MNGKQKRQAEYEKMQRRKAERNRVMDAAVTSLREEQKRQSRCARCGQPARWIAGAGEYLCYRHQNDY